MERESELAQPPTLHEDVVLTPLNPSTFALLPPSPLTRFAAFFTVNQLIELAPIAGSSHLIGHQLGILFLYCIRYSVHKTHRPFASAKPTCGGSQCSSTSPSHYLHLDSAAATPHFLLLNSRISEQAPSER